MADRHRLTYIASTAACAACVLAVGLATPAFATTIDDLNVNYQLATSSYQAALVEQEKNAQEISSVEGEIRAAEMELEQSSGRLGDSAVALYKHQRNSGDLLDFMLESDNLNDVIARYEGYVRIQEYWSESVASIREQRAELDNKKTKLEEERTVIADKVSASVIAVEKARAALADADHSDGAWFHQKQGNGSNCGATSFIVGVNILLHESRYTDNVAVWNGPGFNGDSTQSLAFKGATWLMANGLADQISCENYTGDIHYTEQLKAELDKGNVVVISSGPGSEWQRSDGTASKGLFPDGHWIVFYCYRDGVFYANDSSVGATKGAGCAYTTAQMQQWLNGRGNHFATVLSKKHFG